MVEDMWHEPDRAAPLSGDEKLVGIDGTVTDFWRFAMPDLRMNNVRGYFAEFLVSRALGVEQTRVEWDDYDVLWGDIRVEVKASGYLQSWAQKKPSSITFTGLRGKEQGEHWSLSDEDVYKADVYVFAWHTMQDPAAYEALDIGSWAFHVLSRAQLEQLNVKSIGLPRLDAISHRTDYAGLADAVRAAASFATVTPEGGVSLPARWDRSALVDAGFTGFVRFEELVASTAPNVAGIYVVLRETGQEPEFMAETTSKAYPPFTVDDLSSRWVDDAMVIYIGKSEKIRTRLLQYARRDASHGGGRAIWQLADQRSLTVAWMPTPSESAEAAEIRYRAAFAREHGRWPFANRRS